MVKYNPEPGTKIGWKKNNKKFVKQIPKIDKEIPTRRNIYPREKDEVWENAEYYPNFDKDIFREDILGNVCIKNILYRKNLKSIKFAYEYEHIISYSMGGPTTVNNLCLLNAGINHCKYNKNLYNTEFYEMKGWCSIYGIAFNILEYGLLNNLHDTCLKYNLYFKKNALDEWTVDPSENYKNNYVDSNNVPDKHNYFYSSEKLEIYCRKILKKLGINDNNTVALILGIIMIGCVCWEYTGEDNQKRVRYNIKYAYIYLIRKAKSLVSNLRKISYFGYGYCTYNTIVTGLTCLAYPWVGIPYGCISLTASALVIYNDISK